MTRENVLILLGALVILAPFSGLPLSWLSFILPILGAGVVGIGILMRAVRRRAASVSSYEANQSNTP